MFDAATPVVDFGATELPRRVEARRWVLWPALAWKVLVPEARQAPFNPFQEAVLALCRAKVRGGGDIAERLCLPPDLVRFVVVQLQEMGMLDEHGIVSHAAIRRLDQEEEVGGPEVVGHVFVDAHSGRLWPRFHRGSLPFVRAEIEGGHAHFDHGTTGRPVPVRASVVWPHGPLPTTRPTPQQILAAVRQHARRRRAFALEVPARAQARDEAALDHRSLKRIRRFGTEPESVLIASFFFVPADRSHTVWLAADPLGLGVTMLLQAEALRLAEQKRARVRELLESLTQEAFHVDAADAAAFHQEVMERAAARIRGAVGAHATELPLEVLTPLAEAEERLDRARQSATPSSRLIDDFLGHAWSALEALFGWLVRLYGDPTLAGAVDPDPRDNVWILTNVARGLGFTVPQGAEGIFRIPRASVQRALADRGAPLNARLAAALLAAERDTAHPLRHVARSFPDGVAFLSRLGLSRNSGSHDSDVVVRMADAEALRDDLFRLLRALLGEGDGAVGKAGGWADAGWGTGMRLRLRGQAERAVQGYDGADERPELRARLVEMHEAAILLDLLSTSGRLDSNEMAGRVRDLVVAATIAMESAITELGRAAPCDRSIAPAPGARKNAQSVTRAAAHIGFALDDRGAVPGAVAAARPDRVRDAAFGRRTTLSAMVVAHLLTAEVHAPHPLRRIAQLAPGFVLDIARVVDTRGHGDVVKLAAEAAPRFLDTVRGVVTVVLSALDELET
jgi:hypothetical protein